MTVDLKTNIAKVGLLAVGLMLTCIGLFAHQWLFAAMVCAGFSFMWIGARDCFMKESGQNHEPKLVRLAVAGAVLLTVSLVGEATMLVIDPPTRQVADVQPKAPRVKPDPKEGNAKVPSSLLPVAPWPTPAPVETPPPAAPAPPVAAPPATAPFIQIVPPPVAPDPVVAAPRPVTTPRIQPKPNTAPVRPKSLPAPKAKPKSKSSDDSDSKSKDDTPKHPSWSYTPEKSGSSDRGDENRVTIEDPVLPNN